MASFGRHAKSSCKFSREIYNSLRQSKKCVKNLSSGNLNKLSRKLTALDSQLLQAVQKQTNKMEMRQLQHSAAVMSLTSKVTTCLGMVTTGDTDITEGSEDSDDVCSQTGHKIRKRRWIST